MLTESSVKKGRRTRPWPPHQLILVYTCANTCAPGGAARLGKRSGGARSDSCQVGTLGRNYREGVTSPQSSTVKTCRANILTDYVLNRTKTGVSNYVHSPKLSKDINTQVVLLPHIKVGGPIVQTQFNFGYEVLLKKTIGQQSRRGRRQYGQQGSFPRDLGHRKKRFLVGNSTKISGEYTDTFQSAKCQPRP